MNTVDEIHEAFSTLRLVCDPRGHEVLDALEVLLIGHQRSLLAVLEATEPLEPHADIHRLDPYSRKV